VPGATYTLASGINDAGQIVGAFSDGITTHGFLDTAGSFTTIDVPYKIESYALGINDAGQIVGYDIGHVAPEPGSILLLGSGVAGICALAWRKRRS
jgi:uncharacterized membrane protein